MSSSAPNKLVAFDLDGTLLDTQHQIVSAMVRAVTGEGFDAPDRHAIRRVIGLSLDRAILQLLPDTEAEAVARIADAYRDAYHDSMLDRSQSEPLFEGAVETIEKLEAEGYALAVVTGKGRRGLVGALEEHGIINRFVSLKSADDGPGKPDPTLLLEAMVEAEAERDTTIMLGDTVYDMTMAVNAKVPAIGVSWGYHEVDELRLAGARAIAQNYGDVPGLVSRLLREGDRE